MPASNANLRRDADAAERVLTITRVFDAPRELVFKLWTDPAHAKHWMGPRGFTATHFEQESRPGGSWRLCLREDDSGRELWQGAWFAKSPRRRVSSTPSHGIVRTAAADTRRS